MIFTVLVEVTVIRKSSSLFPYRKIMEENIIHTVHSLLRFMYEFFIGEFTIYLKEER